MKWCVEVACADYERDEGKEKKGRVCLVARMLSAWLVCLVQAGFSMGGIWAIKKNGACLCVTKKIRASLYVIVELYRALHTIPSLFCLVLIVWQR